MTGDPARRGEWEGDAYDRRRRRVLWSLPTGLYVIGSRGVCSGVDRRNLMTANLVMQVATRPKLAAVAVDADAFTHELMVAGGCFSVCLLARDDRTLARRFVKPAAADALQLDAAGRAISIGGEAVVEAVTGAPILVRSPAWLDCEVRHRLELGSHALFVGEVVGVGGAEGDLPDLLRMEDTRMSYGG